MREPKRYPAHGLKALVLASLCALTLVAVDPSALRAEGDECDLGCLVRFGPCKPGEVGGPWEGTWCAYSYCEGTSCYYVCGYESYEECIASFQSQ